MLSGDTKPLYHNAVICAKPWSLYTRLSTMVRIFILDWVLWLKSLYLTEYHDRSLYTRLSTMIGVFILDWVLRLKSFYLTEYCDWSPYTWLSSMIEVFMLVWVTVILSQGRDEYTFITWNPSCVPTEREWLREVGTHCRAVSWANHCLSDT